MDDDTNHGSGGSGSGETLNNRSHPPTKSRKRDSAYQSQHDYKEEESEEDDEVWKSFNDGLRQVQSVLNRNRILIQQVNENHRSKIHSNMVKNVALIQEMNANISKIVSLYSDLSSDFSAVFHQHRAGGGGEVDGDLNYVDGKSD